MSARRTITVTLTAEQYDALAAAAALAECEWQAVYSDDSRHYGGRLRALANAWPKINRAWHHDHS